MSHSEESKDVFAPLLESAQDSQLLDVTATPIEDDVYQDAWARYSAAEKDLVKTISQMIANEVAEHMPDAAFIVLYQDTSHDAPHGHIEAVLDSNGVNLITSQHLDWHDLEWTSDIDEWAWDIHHLSPSSFIRLGERRRFIIRIN